MYYMERFATQVYLSQRRSFQDKKILKKLDDAAVNEQERVDLFRKRIMELQGNRSHIGFLFRTAGRIVAVFAGLFGRVIVLKTDVFREPGS